MSEGKEKSKEKQINEKDQDVQKKGGFDKKGGNNDKKERKTLAQLFADEIERRNVRLVCWDFDETIVVGDSFKGGCEKIKSSDHMFISIDFVHVYKELQSRNIDQCITTFNGPHKKRIGGKQLILNLLSFYQKYADFKTLKVYDGIFPQFGLTQGKNPHLKIAQAEFKVSDNKQVMLIDDDPNNIALARYAGYSAYQVDKLSNEQPNINCFSLLLWNYRLQTIKKTHL